MKMTHYTHSDYQGWGWQVTPTSGSDPEADLNVQLCSPCGVKVRLGPWRGTQDLPGLASAQMNVIELLTTGDIWISLSYRPSECKEEIMLVKEQDQQGKILRRYLQIGDLLTMDLPEALGEHLQMLMQGNNPFRFCRPQSLHP